MGQDTDRIVKRALAQGTPDTGVMLQMILDKVGSVDTKADAMVTDLADVKTEVAVIKQKQDDQSSDIYDAKADIKAAETRCQTQIDELKKTTRYLPAIIVMFTAMLTAAGAWMWNQIAAIAGNTPPPGAP